MKQAQAPIELAALKRAEHVYRTRLANEPNDSTARIKLAWCLFMQALYRAGQESMLNALVSPPNDEPSEASVRPKCIWDQDAGDLIHECLCQTSTVMQLSSDPLHRTDAQRLQTLVKLSGGEIAVTRSRENSSRVLSEFLHEVL